MTATKLASSALAAALAVCTSQASAAPPAKDKHDNGAAASCVFDKYAPTVATPYKTDTANDYGSYSSLGGAQLFVPAHEGLTKEWLAASVQQAVDRAKSEAPNTVDPATCDSPHLQNVSVRVVSGNTGYWVQLISPDKQSSDALLKWARNLTDQHKIPLQTR